MKKTKDVVDTPIVSPYRGSEKTADMVRSQVIDRWGEAVGKRFNPYTDTMPFSCWLKFGFQVKKNEKALQSVTFIEKEDPETGETKTIRKTVNLFHKKQVEKITKQAI